MQATHVKLELRNAVAIVEVDMVGSLLDFQWYGIATVFDEPPREREFCVILRSKKQRL